MKTIDRAGIEKRCKIAAAKAADGTVTYKQLQKQFGAGPRVIADALKRRVIEWEAMLSPVTGSPARQQWDYRVVKVLRQQQGGTAPSVKEKVEGEAAWREVAAGTVQSVLDEHGVAGWELVSSLLAGQDAAEGKWLYELHFKRRAGMARP